VLHSRRPACVLCVSPAADHSRDPVLIVIPDYRFRPVGRDSVPAKLSDKTVLRRSVGSSDIVSAEVGSAWTTVSRLDLPVPLPIRRRELVGRSITAFSV
jgi:hypothetical protein